MQFIVVHTLLVTLRWILDVFAAQKWNNPMRFPGNSLSQGSVETSSSASALCSPNFEHQKGNYGLSESTASRNARFNIRKLVPGIELEIQIVNNKFVKASRYEPAIQEYPLDSCVLLQNHLEECFSKEARLLKNYEGKMCWICVSVTEFISTPVQANPRRHVVNGSCRD